MSPIKSRTGLVGLFLMGLVPLAAIHTVQVRANETNSSESSPNNWFEEADDSDFLDDSDLGEEAIDQQMSEIYGIHNHL